MKNLYQSLLDDEDDIMDRMGDDISANLTEPKYIKDRSTHIMFLEIPKLKELYESGTLKYNTRIYIGDFDVLGIGFIIRDRRYINKEMTKGYKGWSISAFQFTSSFLYGYKKKYNTGACCQNQFLPFYMNCKEAENIADKYMSVSKLSLQQIKQKCKTMFGRMITDENLLLQVFDYCTEDTKKETFIKYDDMINKLLS